MFSVSAGGLPGKIRRDPRLREELAYCVPLGIPHSRFKSWSDDDQDKTLAYLREESAKCPTCKTRAEDWDEDPNAFVSVHRTCPGCQRLEEERDNNVPEGATGVKIGLVPFDVYMANRDAFE